MDTRIDFNLDKKINISNTQIVLKSLVSKFHPRIKEYKDAKYTDQEIEVKEKETDYHIPEHQRFYVWDARQQSFLIDTLISNFPIPDIILSTSNIRGLYYIEDGQQRLTTVWRYMHNLFAFTPKDLMNLPNPPRIFYSEIPKKEKGNTMLLEDISPDAKRCLDEYSVSIKTISNFGNYNFTSNITEIFERLNSGKPLADGDKIWNRKEQRVVEIGIKMATDNRVKDYLKSVFGIDIMRITESKGKAVPKKPLCTIVGMVLGLSIPLDYNMRNENKIWCDVMTTSFPKICDFLDLDIKDEYYEVIIQGIEAISESIKDAPQEEGGQISNTHNSSFNRHLGIMIYDWRQKTHKWKSEDDIDSNVVEKYIEYWQNIIGYFQENNYNKKDDYGNKYDLDHPDHPISSLYIEGDRKNKNTDIGKNIRQRHTQLKKLYSSWITE